MSYEVAAHWPDGHGHLPEERERFATLAGAVAYLTKANDMGAYRFEVVDTTIANTARYRDPDSRR